MPNPQYNVAELLGGDLDLSSVDGLDDVVGRASVNGASDTGDADMVSPGRRLDRFASTHL